MNILLSTASSLPSGEIPVLIWATIGGVLVFIGLAVEKFADWMNDQYLGGPEKPHKMLETAGWCILMFGIFVEIAVAGSSANDAWETRQMAIRNDPLNANISDISAFVWFEVKGADVPDLPPPPVRPYFGIAEMWLCPTNQLWTEFPILNADSFSRGHAESGRSYSLRFSASGIAAMMFSPERRRPTVKEIANVKFLYASFRFLTNNAEVVQGTAEVVVNGSLRRTFQFPPQHPFPNGNPANPYWIGATNFSQTIER